MVYVYTGLTWSCAWESFLVSYTCVFPTIFSRSQCKLIKHVDVNVSHSLIAYFCLEGNPRNQEPRRGNGRHSLSSMDLEQSRQFAHWLALPILPFLSKERIVGVERTGSNLSKPILGIRTGSQCIRNLFKWYLPKM